MSKIYFILSVILLLVFVSCKNETQKYIPNKFERIWYSIDGRLKIDSSHAFEYVKYTCVSQSISKGKWNIVNDTIFLNSFSPYGCYFEEEFGIPPSADTTQFTPLKTTEKNCEPNSGYVNFRNEKFYIKDSILISKKSTYYKNGEFNLHTNFKMKNYYE
ncbi:hypothetical protein HYN48_14225 [Flavobacterium magnum]|uniref:Uncharacterized protein n=1 Tax=Flavobacterium magnum TaxID=2162713 RepID=A0A2S0RHM1_9FLAO|nr:hypothetical protein [Flavobacterium magnum]AWA31156.1 hypothetical protein HYN48_14225 [Flavobacterium magnum]